MNAAASSIAGRPDRPCATCAHRAEAMAGAPSVCLLAGAIRRIEINRLPRGLCGVFGRMWRPAFR